VGSKPTSVAVADLNGDGSPDLVVANSGSDTVSVLLGKGDGTFQDAHNYAAGLQPTAVKVADFNADGIPDVVVANQVTNPGTVTILLGNGDGTLQAAQSYAVGPFPASVAVADFNRDGIPDLAVTGTDRNGQGMLSILLGH